ncbi:hypothetical protein NEOLEDRAFT_1071210 [Neolentinus lepideus HHB14362 ss-1]|uniref:Uncharacterized protein n=1 Tax=Neolentinus lepideus HHB14362 ss-1 TaxID=1314782 RepID=A0A165QK68_9AGAM|nr:hypothetical protein NEOLEDRAFT_1071210 [Neolentinus lepideus HHB14362 ss-1]
MPMHNCRTAPSFDANQPRTILCYLEDLEDLFEAASVTENDKKKKYVTKYVSLTVEDLWGSLASATDEAKTYDDFKTEILSLYPTASETNRKYSVKDVEDLIRKMHGESMTSLVQLTAYYHEFIAITSYLAKKDDFSPGEQARMFKRGLPDEFYDHVAQRLQLAHPTKRPSDSYSLKEYYEAADFVLSRTASVADPLPNHPTISSTAASGRTANGVVIPSIVVAQPTGQVKTEEMISLAESIKSLTQALKPVIESSRSTPAPARAIPRGTSCLYCGEPRCMINTCPKVAEDIRAGICKRDVHGRVVLPSGAEPRMIPGNWIQDKYHKYHRRNPGQRTVGMMTVHEDDSLLTMALEVAEEDPYTLEALTAAHQARRKQVFDGVHMPPRPRPFPQRTARNGPPMGPRGETLPSVANAAPAPKPPTQASPPFSAPYHPFVKARDGVQPRRTAEEAKRDFAKNTMDKRQPAYATRVPVYNAEIGQQVFDRSLNGNITLSTKELLLIAPEIRDQYRTLVTPKRPVAEKPTAVTSLEHGSDTDDFQLDTPDIAMFPEDLYPQPASAFLGTSSVQVQEDNNG